MKKRQMNKILNTYLLDTDEDLLVPPSVYRAEEREMDVYYSKAWRISNPAKAKEMDEAIEKAIQEAQCNCGCDCEGECHCDDDCHCDDNCHCHCEDK